MNKAIIIGASSGIGAELARVLAARGYIVGIAARRVELLTKLQDELGVKSYSKRIDLSQPDEAIALLGELIEDMGSTDTVIICSGVCLHNVEVDWEKERSTVAVNALGFVAMADAAFRYFCESGQGQIVGISSFRGARGGWSAPAYNASKAFMSNYLEGLRINAKRTGKPIDVTDIRPGLVDTSLTGLRSNFLVAPVTSVAAQICNAIEKRKKIVYVPERYRGIAQLMRAMPDWVYSRMPATRQ